MSRVHKYQPIPAKPDALELHSEDLKPITITPKTPSSATIQTVLKTEPGMPGLARFRSLSKFDTENWLYEFRSALGARTREDRDRRMVTLYRQLRNNLKDLPEIDRLGIIYEVGVLLDFGARPGPLAAEWNELENHFLTKWYPLILTGEYKFSNPTNELILLWKTAKGIIEAPISDPFQQHSREPNVFFSKKLIINLQREFEIRILKIQANFSDHGAALAEKYRELASMESLLMRGTSTVSSKAASSNERLRTSLRILIQATSHISDFHLSPHNEFAWMLELANILSELKPENLRKNLAPNEESVLYQDLLYKLSSRLATHTLSLFVPQLTWEERNWIYKKLQFILERWLKNSSHDSYTITDLEQILSNLTHIRATDLAWSQFSTGKDWDEVHEKLGSEENQELFFTLWTSAFYESSYGLEISGSIKWTILVRVACQKQDWQQVIELAIDMGSLGLKEKAEEILIGVLNSRNIDFTYQQIAKAELAILRRNFHEAISILKGDHLRKHPFAQRRLSAMELSVQRYIHLRILQVWGVFGRSLLHHNAAGNHPQIIKGLKKIDDLAYRLNLGEQLSVQDLLAELPQDFISMKKVSGGVFVTSRGANLGDFQSKLLQDFSDEELAQWILKLGKDFFDESDYISAMEMSKLLDHDPYVDFKAELLYNQAKQASESFSAWEMIKVLSTATPVGAGLWTYFGENDYQSVQVGALGLISFSAGRILGSSAGNLMARQFNNLNFSPRILRLLSGTIDEIVDAATSSSVDLILQSDLNFKNWNIDFNMELVVGLTFRGLHLGKGQLKGSLRYIADSETVEDITSAHILMGAQILGEKLKEQEVSLGYQRRLFQSYSQHRQIKTMSKHPGIIVETIDQNTQKRLEKYEVDYKKNRHTSLKEKAY